MFGGNGFTSEAGERSERTAASTAGFGDLFTGIFNVGMMYVVCDTENTPLAKAVFVALLCYTIRDVEHVAKFAL